MYLSSREKEVIEPFCKYVYSCKENYESLYELRWKNGTAVFVLPNSYYESDNDLAFDDPNYEDFIEIIVKVVRLKSFNALDGLKKEWLKHGALFEFNYHDFPYEIYNLKGELISKRED